MKTIIIAEAGDNHNGDVKLAHKLIDVAKEKGADYVKFQTFKTEKIISVNAKMAEYQKQNTGIEESQFDMVKKLELSFDDFRKLKKHCDEAGIKFLTTPFDLESLDFAVNDLGVDVIKIPSGEVTNLPLLLAAAKTGKPVYLSTGMCSLEEVEDCVKALKDNGAGEITLLHCTTQYPAPLESVNLRAMLTLKEKFGCEVGYSDHTAGIEVPVYAVCMGAKVIEKHFTLDKNMPGPDHKASLDPQELGAMIRAVRRAEVILGDGIKRVQDAERGNVSVARKSIVAARRIKKGEVFSDENLGTKRPGDGISPMRWNEVVGKTAKRDFEEDDLIEL